jgi:hypothetical protein
MIGPEKIYECPKCGLFFRPNYSDSRRRKRDRYVDKHVEVAYRLSGIAARKLHCKVCHDVVNNMATVANSQFWSENASIPRPCRNYRRGSLVR